MSLPTPAYDRDGITLYHGDCLDLLPHLPAVDAVVTSPPYNTLPAKNAPTGLHGPKGGRGAWVEKAASGYEDQRDEGEYQEWLRRVVAECLRISSGLVWVNHKVRYRDGEAIHPARFLPFPIYAEVIWDRHCSMALNCKRFAPSHECILAFGRPAYWDDEHNTHLSVWQITPRKSKAHPCPFPHELARRLILASCPPGGVVLDPFGGEGTTAQVAMKSGRRCILIEKDARYIPTIIRRLRECETPLFASPSAEAP